MHDALFLCLWLEPCSDAAMFTWVRVVHGCDVLLVYVIGLCVHVCVIVQCTSVSEIGLAQCTSVSEIGLAKCSSLSQIGLANCARPFLR